MPRKLRIFMLLLLFAPTLRGGSAAATDSFVSGQTGPLAPETADGAATERPAVAALALAGMSIEVDGKLDDPAWALAEAAAGFTQFDPDRGLPASEQTVFKVAYDEDAIYFAVACWERDVSRVNHRLSRRDHIDGSDLVSIYVDPYHDLNTGYNFRVTPDGVQQDAYIFNDGDRDEEWNAVWYAETSLDAAGWYVEVRIPFAAIRFKPADDMTWGLQIYRWMQGRGEDNAWANWDRQKRGFVSRFGTLTNLRGVQNPRQLEARPYLATSHHNPALADSLDGWRNRQYVGADFKYGLTADLTLNAAVQPDFSHVESDPALLNLSPFEVFFPEKRPFFIEGARFFEHPDFRLFYSRRIGLGHPDARIRAAGKLTGKAGGTVTVACLLAATDIAPASQPNNPFQSGEQPAYYGVVRVGKEFDEGRHRFNFMQTAVHRDVTRTSGSGDPRLYRDAYSSGFDFDLNYVDRMYNIQGSLVATVIDPKPFADDASLSHDSQVGSGGALDLRKVGGVWRGGVSGSWESDKLDPNDIGFLSANDEISSSAWLQYRYNPEGESNTFNQAHADLDIWKSWLYAGRAATDSAGAALWSYGSGHRQNNGIGGHVWAQTRSFWSLSAGLWFDLTGTSKYQTRWFDGERGPLMTTPGRWIAEIAVATDWRKDWMLESSLEGGTNEADGYVIEYEADLRLNIGRHMVHRLYFGYTNLRSDAQHLGNFATPGAGIDGVSYVFGRLDRVVYDLTLRSSYLFTRNHSLELYLQPYYDRGRYSDPRYLATADSYDLRPYAESADRYDFNFGAVNVNLVYRWEYRPGSTLYLVWTHGRTSIEQRGTDDGADPNFGHRFDPQFLFGTEPENTLLAKISYWFSI